MQRHIGFPIGQVARPPAAPGRIAWWPTLLAAIAAIAALTLYGACKYFTA
jgi:hypothetical protein